MSSISYDGQCLTLNSRRLWLVSGAIHYTRTPHQLWRKRIRAAKQAGLNCVETYVFWNAHEKRPGEFDFTGDLDLRRFVKTVGEEGMFCILRPGPYICAEWDYGGLPAWLNTLDGIKLRQANGPFLEASARYIGEVMKQVGGLQASSTSSSNKPLKADTSHLDGGGYRGEGGGPIVLMQTENEWLCSNPDQHDGYLRENVRHLRENGCTVPITNCNNLWQPVDGTIDTWNAKHHLAADMRQLAAVRPNAPRIVSELWAGWFDTWGNPHHTEDSAGDLLHRMAGVLSAGAMFNLYMFHGGTNFAFNAGRSIADPSRFITTSYDYDAPLKEAGGRGDKFQAVKRIATFASHFHHVFANLTPGPPHATAAPQGEDHPQAITHLRGGRGDVVFILRGRHDKTEQFDLLLPDGQTLPVPMGNDRAAWLLLDTRLGNAGTLDYTNLRPFALIGGRMLVLFGPAGAQGLVSIDGSLLRVSVPTGKQPVTQKIDGLTLVILNDQQTDAAYPVKDGVLIGAAGIDPMDEPTPLAGWPTLYRVKADGRVTRIKQSAPHKTAAPKLTHWQAATLNALIDGTDPGYETIDGPASLETLGQHQGYGWYRVPIAHPTGAGKLLWPKSADRLHVYHDGKLQKILGAGPDADNGPTALKVNGHVTVLADNLGRFNIGQCMGEHKGVFGPLYKVAPVKLNEPKVTRQPAPDPFVLEGLVYGRQHGEQPPAQALTWTVTPDGRKPMILDIDRLPMACVVTVNGEPVELYSRTYSHGTRRIVLEPGTGPVKGGRNTLTLALYEPMPDGIDPLKHLRFYRVTDTVSDKRAAWAFCPWRPPHQDSSAFGTLPRTSPAKPAWFRASFAVKRTGVPLWLEPVGMSKGQVYLNGHNAGRYWVATAAGKKIPPQHAYYLPEPWLNTDAPNELLLFDEHGKLPSKCRLVYNADGPYG
jgi:beta-galactosidase